MEKLMLIIHVILITSLVFSDMALIAAYKIKMPTSYLLIGKIGVAIFLIADLIFYYNFDYGYRIAHPIHLFAGLLIFPILAAHTLGLMTKKKVSRTKIIVYLSLSIFTLSYLLFVSINSTLPTFTKFSQMQAYLDAPELWIRFAVAFLLVVELTFFLIRVICTIKRNKTQDRKTKIRNKWILWNVFTTLFYGLLVIFVCCSSEIIVKMCCGILYIIETAASVFWMLHNKNVVLLSQREQIVEKYDQWENSQHARQQIKQQLLYLLEEKELFTDPELDREKVRQMLNTNRTYLSEVINMEFKMSFPELINDYRFKKAKNMLRSPEYQSMTLKMIIPLCGFTNLSRFCTIFKQKYGKTPLEWRKENYGTSSQTEE